MKYAIPLSGGNLSQHFGQSTEFMIVNVGADGRIAGKKIVSTIAHNCGALPKLLGELGADVVLAGGMGLGPRMAFESSGIEVVLGVAEADPEKAVMAHLARTLVSGRNVCDHGDTACDHSGHQEHQGGSCH